MCANTLERRGLTPKKKLVSRGGAETHRMKENEIGTNITRCVNALEE